MIAALLTGIQVIAVTLATRLLSWETTRGLLTDYDGTVTGARFIFHPKYQDSTVLLLEWTIATGLADNPEVTELFSCGQGWTTDDGSTAKRKDGGDKFQRSSIYGRVIEGAKADEAAFKHLQATGDPTKAAIWVGTKWRFEEVELDFGKGIDPQTRVMPVAFLGTGEAPAQASAQGAAPSAGNGLTDELKAKLTEIAKSSDSHTAFVAAAVQVPGVQPVIERIADDSDNGLYAQLKA